MLSPERLRNSVVLVDTGMTALAGVLLVIAAARALPAQELAAFSLAQLATVTTVGIVRASVYGPAMATQRTTGRSRVPVSWLFRVALPAAALLAVPMALLIGFRFGDPLKWFTVMLVTGAVVLAQDCLRSVLMSRGATIGALISDSAYAVILALGILLGLFPKSASGILLAWAATVGVAIVLASIAIWRGRAKAAELPAQTLRVTWVIGKWAALDSTFAAVAALLPMFVATLYIGNTSAGTYRTLQSAMGPLNIVHTATVTIFGLDSWRTTNLAGLDTLARNVRRLLLALFVGSALYAGLGVPLMVTITGLEDPDLLRIGILVATAGVLGACSTPFNAASLALGYQRFGAIIRFLVVAASIVISLPIADSRWLPWGDPIGTAMLFSASATVLGWAASYFVAIRRERRQLSRPEPTDRPDPEPAPT